ncbi:MAG: glutaredoxin domain-containing protein [Myxococcota bacterium]
MSRLAIAFLAVSTALAACGGSERIDPRKVAVAAASAATPQPLSIAAGRSDLVFRYLDQAGAVATASKLDDIPAASRRQVVVWDPLAPTPAGWDHVADLSKGLPATAEPRQGFAFATAAAAPRPIATAAADSGNHDVVMFTSAGCGYCAKARKFLKSKSIPYTEMDIGADPAAATKLSSLGQRAGLSQSDLQGVPIIFVDGKPVLGWDESRVSQLLGLHG